MAFSREQPGKRVYVQNLLEDMGAELCCMLLNDATHMYVCGDASMAEGVFEACVSVLRAHGGLSRVSAVRALQVMRAHNRWQTDIWGILSHFAESRDAIRKRKRSAARLWMQHFSRGPR